LIYSIKQSAKENEQKPGALLIKCYSLHIVLGYIKCDILDWDGIYKGLLSLNSIFHPAFHFPVCYIDTFTVKDNLVFSMQIFPGKQPSQILLGLKQLHNVVLHAGPKTIFCLIC